MIGAVGEPEPNPGGYLGVFFTRSAASRQAGVETLGRQTARRDDRDKLSTWQTRQAQYDAVCDWGIPDHGQLQRVCATDMPVFVANGDSDRRVGVSLHPRLRDEAGEQVTRRSRMSATETHRRWHRRRSRVRDRLRRVRAGGFAPAHQRDPVARARDGRRRLARGAARDDAGAGALPGDPLRLAQVRGRSQRPVELPTEIDGLDIHFIHVRVDAAPPDGPAVVLLHGWPYDIHTFAEARN